MGATKEADLITAVLLYAIRCLADGDQGALRAMNFGPKEIEALRGMNLADLARFDALRAHCLEVGLNRPVYWTVVAHLRRERAAEVLQQELITADAPFEMMQTFFGLSSREYTRLRRLLAAAPAVGPPAGGGRGESADPLGRLDAPAKGHRCGPADPRGVPGAAPRDRHRFARRLDPDPALGRVR